MRSVELVMLREKTNASRPPSLLLFLSLIFLFPRFHEHKTKVLYPSQRQSPRKRGERKRARKREQQMKNRKSEKSERIHKSRKRPLLDENVRLRAVAPWPSLALSPLKYGVRPPADEAQSRSESVSSMGRHSGERARERNRFFFHLPPSISLLSPLTSASSSSTPLPQTKLQTRILFVRNLPFTITPEELYDIFGKYGAVRQVRLGEEKTTKGTAFVVFEDIFDAKNAADNLSGFNVGGRYLIVLYFNPSKHARRASLKAQEEELRALQREHGVDGEQRGVGKGGGGGGGGGGGDGGGGGGGGEGGAGGAKKGGEDGRGEE